MCTFILTFLPNPYVASGDFGRLIYIGMFLLLLQTAAFAGLNTTLSLDCAHNKTLEYTIAYQKSGNPCWGWLKTHTYDLANENAGQVLNISSLTISHHTGLYAGCSSITQVLVGNSTNDWKKIDDISVPNAYVRTTKTYGDVGPYRFVRLYNPTCFVDYSAINVSFNDTPNLVVNESEVWYYLLKDDGTPVPIASKVKEGESILINVTVRNNGRSNATSFTVRFKADDKPEDLNGFYQEVLVLDGLEVNKSINVSFIYQVRGNTRNISFFADSYKEIGESDELDNFAYKTLEVESYPQLNYLLYITILGSFVFLLFLLAIALFIWRNYTRLRITSDSVPCPRCGMPVRIGIKKCPVCGKNLQK